MTTSESNTALGGRLETPSELATGLLGGNRRALSRLISWSENDHKGFPEALAAFYPHTGRAWRIGITGPPGAGKSTLVNELALELRRQAEPKLDVGILAVDPSSPFTGGALLGDRIRMDELTADPGVYIRSMASRKSHGGMARAGVDACDVMDAFGIDRILIETVGVGQAEYDVMAACDTVIVVMCPGAGDGIQAMKAGILEVADVLVVNKSDLPGAERLLDDLTEAVHVRDRRATADGGWDVPVVPASAGRGQGAKEVLAAVARHRARLEELGIETVRNQKRTAQVRRIVEEAIEKRLFARNEMGAEIAAQLATGQNAYAVAEALLAQLGPGFDRLTNPSDSPSSK